MDQSPMMIALLRYCRKTFRRGPNKEAGFSVLEALIAMAILSAALIPLLSLQSQFVKTVEVQERAQERLHTKEAALTYIRALNLTSSPEGEMDLGPAIMTWTASLTGPPKQTRGINGTTGKYEMALYDIEIVMNFDAGYEERFFLRGLGWRSTSLQSPSNPF